jgi:hypothetical protein
MTQAIEREVYQTEEAIDEATKRILRTAVATRDVGAATLQQLEQQGEQMQRIKGDQAKVKVNLDKSDKLFLGMTSYLGWRAWGQVIACDSNVIAFDCAVDDSLSSPSPIIIVCGQASTTDDL